MFYARQVLFGGSVDSGCWMSKLQRHVTLAGCLVSLALNWVWTTTPFSRFGLRGRMAALFGDFTLLQTFLLPHPYIILWLSALSLLLIFLALMYSVGLRTRPAGILLILSGFLTVSLSYMIMDSWQYAPSLTGMYVLGFTSGAIPLLLGVYLTLTLREGPKT